MERRVLCRISRGERRLVSPIILFERHGSSFALAIVGTIFVCFGVGIFYCISVVYVPLSMIGTVPGAFLCVVWRCTCLGVFTTLGAVGLVDVGILLLIGSLIFLFSRFIIVVLPDNARARYWKPLLYSILPHFPFTVRTV